jgi:hypothetical protein
MKSKLSAVLFSAVFAVSSLAYVGSASAADGRALGPVTKITVAADGKSAVATMTDLKSKEVHEITITDELTLDKFKNKVINVGDEIRARFGDDPKKSSKSFKKAAGC